jgi:ribosomal protein L16 Arg81 hydroxylase
MQRKKRNKGEGHLRHILGPANGRSRNRRCNASVDINEANHMKNFEQIISPLSRAEFLSDFWKKSFLHLRGQADRFRSLVTWGDLNVLLETDCLKPPNLRLFLDGKPIDPNRYTTRVGKLNAGGLVACLAQGATLIVDHLSNLAPNIRQLAEACEDALEASTNVNLYAGWGLRKGFDLHWDGHDTMMLQLSGRKRWKVYRPTRLHPLEDDVELAPKPTDQPLWDGILEEGDVIYFPRGWWHVACPLNEPSLHLTFGFETPTGADLLRWFVGKLRRHVEVRMDVPRLADKENQQQYIAALRKLVLDALHDEFLPSFFRDCDARRYTRPRIFLPFAPGLQNVPLTMETRIRLAGAHCLSIEHDGDDGNARFVASDRQWSCSAELVPALEALCDKTSLSVQELCARVPGNRAEELKVLFTALAIKGVILKVS